MKLKKKIQQFEISMPNYGEKPEFIKVNRVLKQQSSSYSDGICGYHRPRLKFKTF